MIVNKKPIWSKMLDTINCKFRPSPPESWENNPLAELADSNWFPLVKRDQSGLFKPCLPALYLKLIWCSAHVSLLCSDTRGPGEGWRLHTTGQSVSSLWLTPEIIASQELLMTPSHTVTRDCPSLHFTNTTTVLIGLLHHQLCQLSDNQNDSLLLCN